MTILYQTEILIHETSIMYYIIFVLLVISTEVLLIAALSSDKSIYFIVPFLTVLFLTCSWIPIGHSIFDKEIHTGKYQYECLLSDRATINDIYEKYNVIDRRGDIWILEDK